MSFILYKLKELFLFSIKPCICWKLRKSMLFYHLQNRKRKHLLKVSYFNLRIQKICLGCLACLRLLFFWHLYILRSVSSLLLIAFNFNVSRNNCSFSFQSDVSINVQSTFSSLFFCLLQIYCALFGLFSVRLFCLYLAHSSFSSPIEFCIRIYYNTFYFLCLISKLISTSLFSPI